MSKLVNVLMSLFVEAWRRSRRELVKTCTCAFGKTHTDVCSGRRGDVHYVYSGRRKDGIV